MIEKILEFLNFQIEQPQLFGTFHMVTSLLTIAAVVLFCVLWNKGIIKNIKNLLIIASVAFIVLELYKQIICHYQAGWSEFVLKEFPFQVYSTFIYLGFLAALTKGKPHEHFCSYIATYLLCVGVTRMVYPLGLSTTLGLSIYYVTTTAIIVICAVLLYWVGFASTSWTTLLKAFPIFLINVSMATTANWIVHLITDAEFNLLGISPYFNSNIPVFSSIHSALMSKSTSLLPLSILIYVIFFTSLAALTLYLVRIVERILLTDYNAEYAEMDERRRQRLAERQEKLRVLEEKRKQEKEAERQRKKREKEEAEERKEEERDAKRTEKQRERARKRRENKRRREAEAELRKEVLKERREEEKQRKKEEREEEKRLEKRLKEIEKREKEREKQRKKAEAAERKRKKKEEKAYKKWLREQEEIGNENPDINDFYDEYYG